MMLFSAVMLVLLASGVVIDVMERRAKEKASLAHSLNQYFLWGPKVKK